MDDIIVISVGNDLILDIEVKDQCLRCATLVQTETDNSWRAGADDLQGNQSLRLGTDSQRAHALLGFRELSVPRAGCSSSPYELDCDADGKDYWVRLSERQDKVKVELITLHMHSCSELEKGSCLSMLARHLNVMYTSTQEAMKQGDLLAKSCRDLESLLKEAEAVKCNQESKLYENFVRVLNSKKKIISDLKVAASNSCELCLPSLRTCTNFFSSYLAQGKDDFDEDSADESRGDPMTPPRNTESPKDMHDMNEESVDFFGESTTPATFVPLSSHIQPRGS
jgi:hypothetical protein